MSNLQVLELLNKDVNLSEELKGYESDIRCADCFGEDCVDDDCGGN
jgi:hypothetical protein